MPRRSKIKETAPRKGQRHFSTYRSEPHPDKTKHTRKVKHKKRDLGH